MNRADFQKLSQIRLQEAKVLLDNTCYEGAYYLSGYAVECALKACIAKQIKRYDFPDRKLINDIYTHDLNRLLSIAGLEPEYRQLCKANSDFENSWATVKDWSEQSRYIYKVTEATAKDYYSAVINRKNGIIPWIRKYW